MASVTSLDKDMKRLRMGRYTPEAAKEVRDWIESVLGEQLAPGDLLNALKDGVALCKLANMALPPPGIKYKASSMPFVQMENISHFLRACQAPPLGLQPHDVFLTVDLFESKDPAQVLQCLTAFSRVANRENPSRFPSAMGAKSRANVLSPEGTGAKVGGGSYGNRTGLAPSVSNGSMNSSAYGSKLSPVRTGESRDGKWSPTKESGTASPSVSSWSKKGDQGSTAPAWNIAQYGYMGGANQGNMGVSYGGRRQITTAGPDVPSLAEKEKKRREAEEEATRQKQQMEEADEQRRRQRVADERKAKTEEEGRWAAEAERLREKEREKSEEERRKWEEDERRWKQEEEAREKEEREAESKLKSDRTRSRGASDARLQGQFLSQYQAEQSQTNGTRSMSRVERLERELEQARAREAQYERERQERHGGRSSRSSHQAVENHDLQARLEQKSKSRSRSRQGTDRKKSSDESWRESERDYLRAQHAKTQDRPRTPSRSPVRVVANTTSPSSRPLPDPTTYASPKQPSTSTFSSPKPQPPSRTDRFLSSNPAPQSSQPRTTYASETASFSSSAERDAEDKARLESQKATKAGGWASKSLLEREMELERQRQREWEESQKETSQRKRDSDGVNGIGGGIGGSHDISQWSSYTRGDNQNAGTQGIGAGRRQIVGPRPPPGGGGGGGR